ncbi:MAG: glycosyltransferase family 4 protein [Eubacterium sp.]|nr:glycosyltransferase family 4 protein [Eubacterium sp.]
MNILLSSYSINPFHGSEDGIGWNWAVMLSKHFPDDKIYLLTKTCNEKDTRKGIEEFGLKNIELVIIDPPYWLNWYREHNSAFHHMYYILWQHLAYRWAKKSGIRFDIIHHVTMGDFRITGEMYKIKNAYKIFGPVGGGQSTPKALKDYEKSKLFEKIRELISNSRAYSPNYKRHIKGFDKVYAINKETANIISKALGKNCDRLFELALADEFKSLEINHNNNGTKKIVFVGRLINKKGLMLLLDAVDNMDKSLDFTLEVFGDGPLKSDMESYIKAHSLEEKVTLHGAVEHTRISEAYKNGDIFVMPSLRETSGNVLIEAMAHRLPVVALDMSICSDLKEENCGLFVNTEQGKQEIIDEFSFSLEKLVCDSALRVSLGDNGYNYVNNSLSWENKFETVYGNIRND